MKRDIPGWKQGFVFTAFLFTIIAGVGLMVSSISWSKETLKTKKETIKKETEDMVLIPAGEFQMGSILGLGLSDEMPAHIVYLDAFYMDKYEVTQKEFQDVMGRNPSSAQFRRDEFPVERVTWFEASEFCRRLGKRLPTEAEWEKAARGGTTTFYYWGNSMNGSYLWYAGNSANSIHPVGQKLPNAYQLYDMTGNVWEWVEDWFDPKYYQTTPPINPRGPSEGTYKVLRGGSAFDPPNYLRISYRNLTGPEIRSLAYGFRCVK